MLGRTLENSHQNARPGHAMSIVNDSKASLVCRIGQGSKYDAAAAAVNAVADKFTSDLGSASSLVDLHQNAVCVGFHTHFYFLPILGRNLLVLRWLRCIWLCLPLTPNAGLLPHPVQLNHLRIQSQHELLGTSFQAWSQACMVAAALCR